MTTSSLNKPISKKHWSGCRSPSWRVMWLEVDGAMEKSRVDVGGDSLSSFHPLWNLDQLNMTVDPRLHRIVPASTYFQNSK